jgi:hypothetical protein
VTAHTVMGGVDGWRPLSSQTPVAQSVSAWVSNLKNDSRVATAVSDMAAEINNFYFSQAVGGGTLFQDAPPIWQLVHAKVCTNGSISSGATVDNGDDVPQRTIVDQSYMPDLYLYYDNKMIDNYGALSGSPVQRGNWVNFSNIPGLNSVGGNPFAQCAIPSRGNGGNVWDIIPKTSAPGIRPKTGRMCDSVYVYGNPYNY